MLIEWGWSRGWRNDCGLGEAELERRRVNRGGRPAREVEMAVVGDRRTPQRAKTVQFEGWEAIEFVFVW